MSTSYTLTSCSTTAESPRPASVSGLRVTGSIGTGVLRMMKLTRFVSTTKCRMSSSTASGETKWRRNQTHRKSIVRSGIHRNGSTRLMIEMSATRMRETTRAIG